MAALRFPADFAVGELWWKNAPERGGSGLLLALGVVEVPNDTTVTLSVGAVAEVAVYGRDGKPRLIWERQPAGSTGNDRSIWGEPGESRFYVRAGEQAVDLKFLRALPADSVAELELWEEIRPSSFSAVAHLAPGLRHLMITLDCLDDDGLAIVAELHALESLRVCGGRFTEHGLQRLRGLRSLRHLHIERAGLPPSAFAFGASMPELNRLTGPDETFDLPMSAADVDKLRAMLPRVKVC